jgi:hypothetical protein
MNLSELQRAEIAKWIEQGAKLSDIQAQLATEMGVNLTYMEVRFLVDDLKLVPKDPEPRRTPEPLSAKPTEATKPLPADEVEVLPPLPEATGSGVSVTVDQIARPGALVSGKVTFSDGQKAAWTLDQMGRLGLSADQKGYRPTPADLEQFQMALQNELGKMGY